MPGVIPKHTKDSTVTLAPYPAGARQTDGEQFVNIFAADFLQTLASLSAEPVHRDKMAVVTLAPTARRLSYLAPSHGFEVLELRMHLITQLIAIHKMPTPRSIEIHQSQLPARLLTLGVFRLIDNLGGLTARYFAVSRTFPAINVTSYLGLFST
ncbi:hypothetical protein [Xanthomonas citri]|uniref:hypothetical protein n=1 Tax=Xanthomonas citri TaxID=346 RepID=UPI00103CF6C9|nr:hypothetical protein [Xanthomonas citri]MCC8492274.1 hypothetical protein [Xanthomonas citri pv. fuscans]TBW96966.1 hypothetical protein TP49_10875 [Xanthomonas citri pv. aurantifolii]TBX03180.1 hypothetical protein TP46_12120 [Xanthomonas citri pv. aurantifolii]